LAEHGLAGALDVAVVNAGACARTRVCDDDSATEPVFASDEAIERIRAMGVRVVTAELADPDHPARHALEPLTRALQEVLA
jgi:hypothetical protein